MRIIMDNKINLKLNKIFNNSLNTTLKLLPFNIKSGDSRKIKYLPPVSKEWKNTIYSFDKNYLKNLPINDLTINSIIRYYFNLSFVNNFFKQKFLSKLRRSSFLRKIYVSNSEIKHTYNKAIVTIYTVNLEKKILYTRYIKSKIFLSQIEKLLTLIYFEFFMKNINTKNNLLSKFKENSSEKQISENNNLYVLFTKFILKKHINRIRKAIYLYQLNKFKFEKPYFLSKLSNMLYKIYNKKVEFNIINLKSFIYNPDIFTEALAIKLRKKKFSVFRVMNAVIGKTNLPTVNKIIERANLTQYKDLNLLENKFKDTNLSSILNKEKKYDNIIDEFLSNVIDIDTIYLYKYLINLEELKTIERSEEEVRIKKPRYTRYIKGLQNIRKTRYLMIYKAIIDSINSKNIGGIRLEVKGRLTRRYRADRAFFKLKWKGGLQNIDSSYRGLSSVLLRGHLNSNVAYSIAKSKRRVGAYAVKGWISGK
jgi:hypothetical protein